MSLVSENVIPGKHGKVFETNAKEHTELEKIKSAILSIEGIESVNINSTTFPVMLTVCSSKIITVKAVEDAVVRARFHIVLKSILPLQ